MTKKLDLLLAAFGLEYVRVTTTMSQSADYLDDTGNPVSQTNHIAFDGVLIDVDDNFVYLGFIENDNPVITDALSKKQIAGISYASEPKDEKETDVQVPNREDLN